MSRDRRAGIALGLALVVFGLLLAFSHYGWQPTRYVDQHTLSALHRYALDHSAFVTTMRVVSAIGSWSTYSLLFAATAGWLLARRQRRLALFVAVTPLSSTVVNRLTKAVVDRPRPQLPRPVAHAGGLSFPSGHAQSATVAALVMLVVLLPSLRRRGRWLAGGGAAVFVAVVGFSRVALGVHYVSDVLAGYALGVAWVVIVALVLAPHAQPRTSPSATPGELRPRRRGKKRRS